MQHLRLTVTQLRRLKGCPHEGTRVARMGASGMLVCWVLVHDGLLCDGLLCDGRARQGW